MAILRWLQRALRLLHESRLEASRLVTLVSYQERSE